MIESGDMTMQSFNMPVIPAFKPDKALTDAIRAAIEARKLNQLRRAVDAARRTA